MPGDWDYAQVRREIENMKSSGWASVSLDMSNASCGNVEQAAAWAGDMGYRTEIKNAYETLVIFNKEKTNG